jgi:hypothetical protein
MVPFTRWADFALATVVEACDCDRVDEVPPNAAPEATRHPAKVKTSNARKAPPHDKVNSRPRMPGRQWIEYRPDRTLFLCGPPHSSFKSVRQSLEFSAFRVGAIVVTFRAGGTSPALSK